jgi:hypothetical protein
MESEVSDIARRVRRALRGHCPEPIPESLQNDPELDLGSYWFGLSDARVRVRPDPVPYTAEEVPENTDFGAWFGVNFQVDSMPRYSDFSSVDVDMDSDALEDVEMDSDALEDVDMDSGTLENIEMDSDA